MKRYTCALLIPFWGLVFQASFAADVHFDRDIPQMAFAAAELSDAISEDVESEEKQDWKFETFAVILSDGEVITSGHGKTEDEIDDDQVKKKWAKLEASFQFDTSGKLKVRDDFLGVSIFRSRSKVDPGPRRCEFKDGAVATYNLIEPVSVLWSTRIWDADARKFKRALPTEMGFKAPFEFVITRGKKLAITGTKNGQRQIAWSEDPNYEDWTGQFRK